MTLKPDMSPDDHATHAEELLETARGFTHWNDPAKASLERQAIAHATLSLRAPKPAPRRELPEPKPARKKPGPKTKTDTKENEK